MDSRARKLGLAAICTVVLVGGLAWWASPDPPAPRPDATPTEETPRAARGLRAPPLSTDVEPHEARTAPEHLPAGEVDPCGSDDDDPPVVRPSISELVQLRVAELNDRMTAIFRGQHGSTQLAEGWRAAQDPNRESEALRLLAAAPDRVDEGFDTYVAVLIVHAANALHAGDAARAVRLSGLAVEADPGDELPLLIAAVAHSARRDDAASRDALARAFAIDPEEPAIALNLAYDLEHGADVSAALVAFDAYLDAVPADRDMARRRARLRVRHQTFASAQTWARGGLRLVADPSLPRETALHVLDVVEQGLAHGAQLLGVPARAELAIFVHPDRAAMRRATCVQSWAGAVFDGALETDQETILGGGDRSLVHESFHAAIHPAVPNVPTWLDEGLAQYASGEEGPAHRRSYELMLREHTWIPFSSMNDAFLAIDDTADAGLAYHQALAMVQWLVEQRGEHGIREAAAWLSGRGDPAVVLGQAAHAELDGEGLLAFLRRHLASQAPMRAP